MLESYLIFGKTLNLLWKFPMLLGTFSFLQMGKYGKKYRHLVTLYSPFCNNFQLCPEGLSNFEKFIGVLATPTLPTCAPILSIEPNIWLVKVNCFMNILEGKSYSRGALKKYENTLLSYFAVLQLMKKLIFDS